MRLKINIQSLLLAIIFCLLGVSLKANTNLDHYCSSKNSINKYFEIFPKTSLSRADIVRSKTNQKTSSIQIDLYFTPVKESHYFLSKLNQKDQMPKSLNQTFVFSLKKARGPPSLHS